MGVKIPKQELVEYVLVKKVKALPIESQADLTAIVNRELQTANKNYRVSGRRLRKLALGLPNIKVTISVKKGVTPEACPVCKSRIEPITMKNLVGKKVLYKISCGSCPYESQGKNTAPKAYGFHWKR